MLRRRLTRSKTAVPALVGTLSLLATLSLWTFARRDQHVEITAEAARASADVVSHLIAQYNVERQQLIAMGAQLAFAPDAWSHWSRPYLVGQPIHRSALWIDRQFVAREVDGANDPPLQGIDFSVDPARAALLREAATTHEQIVVRADDLQRGRLSLLVVQPVYTRDGFAGLTAAILDVETLLRLTLEPHEENGYGITVRSDGRGIYKSSHDDQAIAAGVFAHRTAELGPLSLHLDVWPMPEQLSSHSGLSSLTLVFGLLVTALLTMTSAVALTAHRRSTAIERVNHLLAAEIARRQQAQRELQQMAEELTRSNRELEDFAGIASHDLRAPLQKVKSFADLLEEDYKPVLDDDGRDILERLRRSVSRMQRLVDDLLALARVRAKGRPFTRVDLAQVARDVVSDLEPTLRASGGLIEVGELPVIDADPTQMHQLLQNLAGNGLKFQKPGDRPLVRIEATVVEQAGGASPLCRLRVSDNGIGFDNKHALRIFRPFERLHGQQDYEGSGIGLAVCAKIAERHGGTIMATGVHNEGASFLVTLPVRHAPTVPGQKMVETAEIRRQTVSA